MNLIKKYRSPLLIFIVICIVTFLTSYINGKVEPFNQNTDKKEATQTIYVQRVTTPEANARGLMHRKEPLGPNQGMLFDKGDWSSTGFWMQNTHIPLDILFLDDSYEVIDILYDMKPFDTTSRSINKPWRYAIEINAGAMRHITPGTFINVVDIDRV